MMREHVSSARFRRGVRDALLIIIGSAIFAIGLDCFEVPNGLAAGGVTGLATVIHALGKQVGLDIPIGMQTIVMNIALLMVVFKTGSRSYIIRTIAGILACGIFTDVLAPYMPAFAKGDLLISAVWGGVITGFGLGLVFKTGGNTGGSDIIVQLLVKAARLSFGTACLIVDGIIIALSAPVFSIENALYATIALFICAKVLDMTVDGLHSQRAAYIISTEHEKIAEEILYTMNRGCTELQARGVWSGNSRPVLLCFLGRAEAAQLKEIVSDNDPEAIMVISEVHEVFGEGFKQFEG